MITADGGFRRGAPVDAQAERRHRAGVHARASSTSIVVKRVDEPVDMQDGRDLWWHDLMEKADAECPCEPMDSEDLLYLLYTSGTTAKPKGIMHTTGGYLTQVAFTHKYVFDLHPDTDIYWCAADIGWVTGHSYIVYGPLTNGATSVIYEGVPDTPGRDRLWDIAERYGVTILYTAPTAIRTFMKWGAQEPEKHDLSKLRLLGSVGEPINPEAWMWYHDQHRRRPVPDRRHVVADRDRRHHDQPAPGRHDPQARARPRSRCPGIEAEVVDEAGNRVDRGGGYLTLTRPWPSMLRGIYGDPERYQRDVLGQVRRPLLRRRRLQARRRRLPLAARPRRRRDERVRPPHLHHRGGERARRPPRGGRGGGGRRQRRRHRAGDHGLRHRARHPHAERRARRGGAPARRQEARRHRPARRR